MEKRILILGAGDAQLNLIKSAKKLNYYTVVCDMRSEMEGTKMADKYYKVDYMNKDAIYSIACKEKIDGVISNSEPAMINVSYLVDKMKLPGNSVESLKKLLSKSNFRDLQQKVGVYSPKSFTTDRAEKIINLSKNLTFPVIVKPSESSGSRGTTQINEYSEQKIKEAFIICQAFSRNANVTIEEFVEMESLEVINADVFVVNDDIIWDGWYGGLRSFKRPMIPMAKILPPDISKEREEKIKNDVNKILKASGVSLGEFNVETFFSKKGELLVIEINPRQAGDDIPELIKESTGVDFTKLLVSLSVGDRRYYDYLKTYNRQKNYITLQVVFSDKDGEYQGLFIKNEIRPFVCWVEEFLKKGDVVYQARNAEDSVAYVDLKFDTIEQQRYFTKNIEKFIYPLVR